MTREVFILGTFHKLQCGTTDCGAERISLFEEQIRRVKSEYGIRRIAEEMSDDGLRRIAGDNAAGTVCERIAGTIPVHFVDLGVKERAQLSLSDDDILAITFNDFLSKTNGEPTKVREALTRFSDEVRERVWVARVLSRNEWPVLIVCGADHVDSVGALFRCIGIQATIICCDFDPDANPQQSEDAPS